MPSKGNQSNSSGSSTPNNPVATITILASQATADISSLRSSIETALKAATVNPPKIKLSVDISTSEMKNLYDQIKSQLNGTKISIDTSEYGRIEGVIGKVTKAHQSQTSAIKESTKALKEYNAEATKSSKSTTINESRMVGKNTIAQAEALKLINEVKTQYEKIKGWTAGDDASFASTEASGFTNKLQEWDSLLSKLEDNAQRGTISLQGVKKLLKGVPEDIQASSNAMKDLGANMSLADYQKSFSNLSTKVKELRASLKNTLENSTQGKDTQAYKDLENTYNSLVELDGQLDNHSVHLKNATKDFESFKNSYKGGKSVLDETGNSVKTFGDRVAEAFKKYSSWFTGTNAVIKLYQALKQLVSVTIEIDDAMTQLSIVTRASQQELEAYSNTAIKIADRTAGSITDIIDSTTTYARLGYSLKQSSSLAEMTAMLQNVGDIDASSAQDAITAMTKAFNSVNADNLESVLDKMVTVGK